MNSDPPAFDRIGYYESFNFERDRLRLPAKNANTVRSCTQIQRAFDEIDPKIRPKGNGDAYLRFLTTLEGKVDKDSQHDRHP
ncbi:hypothetical protein SAPIO_CDS8248 [Scedosporium apiospermum]|uniref:Uncharacterized protein n=1 Tax=Pseudallescheria apiosperma TaxID=563466 RepID=A0A084FZ78_PSEDA|nr:uncharacterized protein SAPIO_CDS8248 [Scedosporium apiospermum]KEZ40390.1 hypothetical protein SAPIO_CDS8248 [Scedosporium apiospermum]